MKKLNVSMILVLLFFSSASFAAPVQGRYFDRVVFVIFENTNYQDAIRQPFFKQLADLGAHFNNFTAETHPSQGNYIALTSGSLNGVTGDGKYDLDVNHIGDLLDARGISWKVYAEGYPGGCFLGTSKGGYARKHNPFISYVNIQKNLKRCANIVSSDEFDRDIASATLPQFVFFIPNQKNDGHDTGVQFADRWYQKRFSGYFANPTFMQGTLVVTTFDESAGARGNPIYTSFIGPMIQAHSIVSDPINHYSVLRLIEDNWGLGTLGKEDARASMIPNIWK